MKKQRMFRYYLFSFLFLSMGAVGAACRYPVPDGSGLSPSKPNLVGIIEAIEPHEVRVKTPSGRIEKLTPPPTGVAYSAFGGDDRLSNVRVGVATRIWFQKCSAPARGRPRIAYLEIFSNDPLDLPPKDYLKR